MLKQLTDNPHGQFSTEDYTVFVLMLSVSAAIGIYFGFFEGKKNQTTDDYLLGGRKMKIFPIAVSLIASQLSGVSIMSVPAEMYSYGAQYWIIAPTMIVIVLIINYIFVPVFYNNQITNCYQYLEDRFDPIVKKFVTITYVLNVYLILPIFIFIPSLAFAQVTGINIHLINGIVCCVCVFYTMLGGIKAVVWTDVVQGVIMFASCFLVVAIGVCKIGGFVEVFQRAATGNRLEIFNMTVDVTARQTFWTASVGNIFLWTGYLGLNQSCVQRMVAVPSIKHARAALWIFCVGFIVITSLNCFTGIVIFAKYFDCDPIKLNLVEKADNLLPFFVQDVIGNFKGMPGVFISCVFSAGLSTMSANLNSLAGIVYEDYIRPFKLFKHSDASAKLAMKALIFFSGLYCIVMGLVVEQFGHILQMVVTIASVTQGAVMGIFCLGMLWPWANKHGALWGSAASVICVSWLIAGAQFAIKNGTLSYPPQPTSVKGCSDYGFNVTRLELYDAPESTSSEFSIFNISFVWYSTVGTFLVFLIGIPVSYLTGSQDLEKMQSKLISPVVHWMLPSDTTKNDLTLKASDDYRKSDESLAKRWNMTLAANHEREKLNGNNEHAV
ncbi:sodium-coupled monocarboxylate transporter 2-like [Toxorhynchites rutilus septentrionalis]|uniref:sodium-coupled monocarboxylate transporter 2-like n=1 Tax=Toxorhynchites rutilus septentrionalis TaxID=329112 RepID=UPI0024783FF0|nr:sodium-coupled monocarboxylate transporter 2-like [Toxorhynchites rutilus septentrionalis]XP_055635013.1 sodium-coupled monocarboxylate transporter 2-like [Toxorhynchites rutilus septentrionalis]